MPDFNVRSDAVNVEQIMEQIRARIQEKRGVDYTEAQIRELASVKLEKFLDPRGVRSDLLEQFRRAQPPFAPPELPNFAFEDQTLFESTRGPLRFIRRLLLPILKLFFNPNPLIQALNIQSRLNAGAAEREAKRDAARHAFDQLHYEVMHNLVLETTRLGIEVKNLKMRLESLASRLEFNERRARALESAVVYKPSGDERPPQDARRDDPRRDDTRRDDPRRDDNRRDDARREDPRRDERRQESRRPDQPSRPAPPPSPVAPAEAVPAVPPQAEGVEAGDTQTQVQPATGIEGPGQKSRRRRRRRGRRGSGAAAVLMGETGQPGGDVSSDAEYSADLNGGLNADQNEAENEAEGESDALPAFDQATDQAPPLPLAEAAPERADSRQARPEPFEHTFGAQAHPAEPATSDPSAVRADAPPVAPAPAPEQPAPQPDAPIDPKLSAAPEQ
ncbi:MAG TPA: hypothetical protein VM032_13215 [Vicinamibacterales bacterium]|nr:hypothetical protein [Vicinamibacterales bacterium]